MERCHTQPKYKWDFDDQGISADFGLMPDLNNVECYKIEDDVFMAKEDNNSEEAENNILVQLRRAAQTRESSAPVLRHHPNYCSVQWSVSHRCIDCAWKKQRGGRPKHPPPPIPSSCSSPPMVTLQSLSTTRDSGYEPSPTSGFSFTFSDDEENDKGEDTIDITKKELNITSCGVTPPINIPARTFGVPDNRCSRLSRPKNKLSTNCLPNVYKSNESNEGIHSKTTHTTPDKKSPTRKRASSAPEFGGNELLLQRTPLIIRNTNFFRAPLSDKVTPIHGRNYSLPVTTPDGRPLIAPPLSTPSSRASREGLIDLAGEDPEGSAGHRRRVLVLALPDIIVDVKNGDSLLHAPLSPSEASTASSCLSRESSTGSSDSRRFEAVDIFAKPRPTWRRPRALSCDVTLEVEVGQGLRKIADNFTKQTVIEHEGGVWRQLHNSIVRRLSLGAVVPVAEGSPSSSRGTQSLPSSPNQAGYRSGDSDFEDYVDVVDFSD